MQEHNTINLLFEAQAARTPDSIAISYAGRNVTYRELNSLANQAAHYLLLKGASPETFVGVIMDHSPEMIAAILGVIKSGAAYVAVEPDFPRERLAFIMEETGAELVFTEYKYSDLIPKGITPIFPDSPPPAFPDENPMPDITGRNAIYALYTSGTTGSPKGVVIEHHNVVNYVHGFIEEFGLNESDRMLQCSVCTFDIFVEEVYPVLLAGGTLVIAGSEERADARLLASLMEREKVTIFSGFPYLLKDLNKLEIPVSLRVAISGGDVLRKEYVTELVRKVPVYNTYGPSETTVCATYYRYTGKTTPTGSIPVGRPISGVNIYILDERLKPVGSGETGEICISGGGVGRGYLGCRDENARVFVPNPFDCSSPLYLTGDIGVMLDDGNISFISRKDRQVMIKGKRVEPSEVENVMSGFAGIDFAVVRPFRDGDSNFLAAYYVGCGAVKPSAIRAYMMEYLPEYMIPEYFMRLDNMPRTLNGKIDIKRLPEIDRVKKV